MVLENKNKKTAFLHVSCSEWKNIFSLEIYGKKGKISIDGLGGSYGTEIVTFYKMSKKMGPPATYKWEYPMPDNSWEIECKHFLSSLKNKKQDNTLKSAINILRIIGK
jgi:predicted dehydrogenase